jgi:hypothetical protein
VNTLPVNPPRSLYELTPAVYRIADAELGEPLRALMNVLEEPYRLIEADVGALYDNWFIETCADWLVPYIGQLVGVSATFDPSGVIPTVRARVANALAYARRKGPAWVLAHAARDATGWQVRAVEYYQLLSRTQTVADLRPGQGRTADLRFRDAVEAGSPFDRLARTVEVRGADSTGRWAADRVGLFLWRLSSYPLTAAQPHPVGPGRYTFSPFGVEANLFLPPLAVEPMGAEPPPWDVPGPLTRELLLAALEDHAARRLWEACGYPVVAVYAGDDAASATRARVVPADLSGWRVPAVDFGAAERSGLVTVVAVDPELGRLAFVGSDPAWVRADWSYGFSADVGGGPYVRSAADPAPPADAFVARVGLAAGATADAESVDAALARWARSDRADGVVLIVDSATHALPAETVALAPGRRLWMVAAAGQRPCLTGSLRVEGVERSGVVLAGLAVPGTVRLAGEVDLTVVHCTMAPPAGAGDADAPRAVQADASFTGTVDVRRSILGPLMVPRESGGITLSDSIVAGGVYAVAAGTSDADTLPSAPLSVERCTLFGVVRAGTLRAADSIFVDPVLVDDPTTGGLTCCYALPGLRQPPRERCQPTLGSAVRPVFTSRRYGDAAFAQLDAGCPDAIRYGAGDGAEMGVFHLLDAQRRESNLRATIDEFLPNGLEVVLSYVT